MGTTDPNARRLAVNLSNKTAPALMADWLEANIPEDPQ